MIRQSNVSPTRRPFRRISSKLYAMRSAARTRYKSKSCNKKSLKKDYRQNKSPCDLKKENLDVQIKYYTVHQIYFSCIDYTMYNNQKPTFVHQTVHYLLLKLRETKHSVYAAAAEEPIRPRAYGLLRPQLKMSYEVPFFSSREIW